MKQYILSITLTCSAGEVRKVEPSVAAVLPSSSEPAAEAVVSLKCPPSCA